jgi:RNA polymerase sigma factor FliA
MIENHEIWRRWREAKDEADREAVIKHFAPIVRRIAFSIPRVRPQDRDDLVGAGWLALVNALNSFDPSRGMSLEQFVYCKIRYGIINYIRSASWAKKGVRHEAELQESAEEELAQTLGRSPTSEELAEHLDLDVDQLAAARSCLRATNWNLRSLEDPIEMAAGTSVDLVERLPVDTPGPEEALLLAEDRAELRGVLDRLPTRLREVLVGHLLAGQQQQEIAVRLGCHPSRVSQLVDEALVKARELAYQRVLPR